MRMKLNKTSYCHRQIRALCFELEQRSGLKCITDLDEEFEDIKFYGKLSYIRIDWLHNAIFTLSYTMDRKELQVAQDIILDLDWLETGKRVQDMILHKG